MADILLIETGAPDNLLLETGGTDDLLLEDGTPGGGAHVDMPKFVKHYQEQGQM